MHDNNDKSNCMEDFTTKYEIATLLHDQDAGYEKVELETGHKIR